MFIGELNLKARLESSNIVVSPLMDGALKGNTIDFRLGKSILIPKNQTPLDPLNDSEEVKWEKVLLPEAKKENLGKGYLLKKGEFVLGHTLESFSVPLDLIAMVNSRSTSARYGLVVHKTAPLINAGHGMFEGNSKPRPITLEITTDFPNGMMLYEGLIVGSIKFAELTEPAPISYDSRPTSTFGQDHAVMMPTKSRLLPDR